MEAAGVVSAGILDLRARIDAASASCIEGDEPFRAHLDALVADVLRLG